MTYSYFPGCTLKNKAKDLDKYARECAKVLGFELEDNRCKAPEGCLLQTICNFL